MKRSLLIQLLALVAGGPAAPVEPVNLISPRGALTERAAFGDIIYRCAKPNAIALTFDDGPAQHTGALLDLLDRYGAKATFFITGNSMAGDISNPSTGWPQLLQRMHNTGHQLGSHTWTHADLDAADHATRLDQMARNEAVFKSIFGFRPAYMRPPYGACVTAACLADMKVMGYHVVLWDVDSRDWANQQNIAESVRIFDEAVRPRPSNLLVLAHDIHAQTVQRLAEHMIDRAKRMGYELVTVGECMGDQPQNWYHRAA